MDRALFYVAPQEARIVECEAPPITTSCELRVRALYSGLSRGTERLVFAGKIPASEHERMRAPFQEGDFPFPVCYGYASVGEVVEGPEGIVGKRVFALVPHRDSYVIPRDAALELPDDLPTRRAVLAANMETALNAVWDGGVGPGDRIAIIGAGVLGGLLAGLCGAIPGTETTLVDVNPARRALADHMNVRFGEPDAAPNGCDVVFHTSATASGAATALGAAGFEARLVELSWFGADVPALPLGGAFHSQRLHYISSQVGHVATSRRARWTHRRRLAKALDLLRDPRFDALITEEVAFAALPAELPRLLAPGADGLATAVRYG